ncbi:Protein kinase domain [Phytophthora infestans]|uniref:Protein kinase domain n=1 Tax=Phytophthora infestans TaxID=4787 RepID=A0A8S9USC6_PHYIN|nr:Protein kinase domain [Phytophthora infestans]
MILTALVLAVWSTSLAASTCSRVALGSQSATKWTVRCINEDSDTTSSASFDPLLVNNYYVDNGASVVTSGSDLKLSSAFSEVDALVSSFITTFSLLAAAGFTPETPVNILPTSFSEISTLQTLNLEGIPIADSDFQVVLPKSIQKISIVGCGLRNISLKLTDSSAVADSIISFVDLRQNHLGKIPAFIYDLSSGVSTIDLRNNPMDLSTETSAHKRQLTEWIEAKILYLDSEILAALDSFNQEERNSIVGTAKAARNKTESVSIPLSTSSGSEESVTTVKENSSGNVPPITILSIAIPAMLVVGFTLGFALRKRRRLQERDTDGILELPHPFDKSTRERSETSGHFTAIESELSRSQMSTRDNLDVDERDSCFIIPMSPTNSEQPRQSASCTNASYVNLKSPQIASKLNRKRQVSKRENGDSNHSLELLSTHSTASATPAQVRIAARNALRAALKTLVTTKSNDTGQHLLTVNGCQYAFNTDTDIEETPLAFFISCRLVNSKDSSDPAPLGQLVLKVFIEEDADLAGRESYALSCLQNDDFSRRFAPRLVDDALEYELKVGQSVKIGCCILVLNQPDCTTLRAHIEVSREPLEQQIYRVVAAVRALHTRGLVHGALDIHSLVACSPDGRLKFWGLEHASRAGHKVPCPDTDLISVHQAEYIAPELAALTLDEISSFRTSFSLDIWNLGVIILKMYASGHQLEEFKDCSTPHDVFERLTSTDIDEEQSYTCLFERSITRFVPNDDMKDLLRQCLNSISKSRPTIEAISKHKLFDPKEREVSRLTTVTCRMLSAIIEERELMSSCDSYRILVSTEPGFDQDSEELKEELSPEPLPPSLWLFLPPKELEIDLTQRANFFSEDQWVSKLKRLQEQRVDELRFPLVFMCESCESGDVIPCSIATTTKYGVSVSSSLLSLVMPLVRETMLFLEARAILSNGLSIEEVSGLTGPQQWEELRTFYSALERMELATVNLVNKVELAPMEQLLKSRDRKNALEVLDQLTNLIFSEDKREYVRNLLDALVTDENLLFWDERSSWAALRRVSTNSEALRWLCSHHAP